VRRSDPAPLPHAGHQPEERGLPRDLRRVLAAARPDDVRRPRRRPDRRRHRPVVRARPPRAPLPSDAAERSPVHHDRGPHRVDRRADPGLPCGALQGCAGSRPVDEPGRNVRAERPDLRAGAGYRPARRHDPLCGHGAREARPALAPVSAERHAVSPRVYRSAKIAAEIAVPILLVVAWQLYTVANDDPKFPRPTTILAEFQDLWLFSQFDAHVVPSLERIGLGFAIAVLLGVALGIPLGLSRIGRSAAMPHIEYWRAIP